MNQNFFRSLPHTLSLTFTLAITFPIPSSALTSSLTLSHYSLPLSHTLTSSLSHPLPLLYPPSHPPTTISLTHPNASFASRAILACTSCPSTSAVGSASANPRAWASIKYKVQSILV